MEVRGLSGIFNMGNTCYLNSATQCLIHIPELTRYFLDEKYKEDLNAEKKESKMVLEYARLVKGLWEENCVVKPISFKNTLGLFYSKFSGNQQQDAQEVLSILLDLFHIGLSYQADVGYRGEPKNELDKITIEAIKAWGVNFKNEYSYILDLFFGQYHSILQCQKCQGYTHNFDPFSVLTLPIHGTDIYQCLDYFCQPEKLDTNNQWKCEKCEEYSDAVKAINFWKLPRILVIAFKRFSFNNVFSRKINNLVDFPMELNLEKYVNSYEKYRCQYQLFAMINHVGGLGGGHYYAYSLNPEDGNWYNFNDANVDILKETTPIKNNAYVLFYRFIGDEKNLNK